MYAIWGWVYAKCASLEFGVGEHDGVSLPSEEPRVISASQWLSNLQCIYNATDSHQKHKPNLSTRPQKSLKVLVELL